jgi:hypothetical protein
VPRSRHFAGDRVGNSRCDYGIADQRAGKPDVPICGGKALAERRGVPLALDISGFRNYALRPFLLDRLRLPEAVTAVRAEPAERPEINFTRAAATGKFSRLGEEIRAPHCLARLTAGLVPRDFLR